VASLESQLGLDADQAFVAQALASDPIIAQLRVQLYEIESQLAVLRNRIIKTSTSRRKTVTSPGF